MSKSEMVKRAAAAMWAAMRETKPMLSEESVLAGARAAIEAIREPTETMIEAGEDAILSKVGGSVDLGGNFSATELAKQVYSVMIDDALADQQD